MLRNAPRLYDLAEWAENSLEEKPNLRKLVSSFHRLAERLRHAPLLVECDKAGCKRPVHWMTFALHWTERYLMPGPSFWCEKHELSGEDTGDESERLPVHFDAIKKYDSKRERRLIHRAVLEALGIKREPSRISEKLARAFFSNLP